MNQSPTIEEVRKARSKIAAAHGHDPKRLVKHYIEMQKKKRAQLGGVGKPATRDEFK